MHVELHHLRIPTCALSPRHGNVRVVQSFKSPVIASATARYSYLDMVPLFELMCNLATIARCSLV